jgi:hypothetical protein
VTPGACTTCLLRRRCIVSQLSINQQGLGLVGTTHAGFGKLALGWLCDTRGYSILGSKAQRHHRIDDYLAVDWPQACAACDSAQEAPSICLLASAIQVRVDCVANDAICTVGVYFHASPVYMSHHSLIVGLVVCVCCSAPCVVCGSAWVMSAGNANQSGSSVNCSFLRLVCVV